MPRWLCACMQIGPEAKYFISVTWELTPPHRGGFCNYILSCQTLLFIVYHAPYVSHRDIIVVLISGPKPSGNIGKATFQQCPNNMLLDNSEIILAHQLPFYPWSASGSLATD